jgi:hypothetical protein
MTKGGPARQTRYSRSISISRRSGTTPSAWRRRRAGFWSLVSLVLAVWYLRRLYKSMFAADAA